MTRPIVRVHDIQTNETVDREMNDAEFEAYQERQARFTAQQVDNSARQAEREALLARLNITSDEARLLLG